MKKTAFIIPGFFSSPYDQCYKTIGHAFESKGYTVHYAEITWKYKRIADWVEQFITIYTTHKGDSNSVFGFSYGAMVAFLAAQSLNPNQLLLASLTPYFSEDNAFVPKSEIQDIGKRRYSDMSLYSFNTIAKSVQSKVSLFYGEKEQPFVIRRAKLAAKILLGAKLFTVKNTGHNISSDSYLQAIFDKIRLL